MKLIDLSPKWNEEEKRYLVFDCPAQHDRQAGTEYASKCRIVIPIKEPGSWQATSEDFSNMTIRPSIWHHCEKDPHFFITNGEIEIA